jgi:hypothetical protein
LEYSSTPSTTWVCVVMIFNIFCLGSRY